MTWPEFDICNYHVAQHVEGNMTITYVNFEGVYVFICDDLLRLKILLQRLKIIQITGTKIMYNLTSIEVNVQKQYLSMWKTHIHSFVVTRDQKISSRPK